MTMPADLGHDLLDAESNCGRVAEHAGDERAQAARVFVRGMRLLRCGGDERPDAAPRFEDARPLELRVDPRDRVGVHAEIDGELADGWKLIADLQAARGDCCAKPTVELGVDGRPIARVDGNEGSGNHVTYNTSSLVQVKPEKRAGGVFDPQPSILLTNHLQRIGRDHHLAFLLGDVAGHFDGVRDMGDDLGVLFGCEAASPMPITIGFLEISANGPIAVTAVYTATGLDSSGVSIEVEQIAPRRA